MRKLTTTPAPWAIRKAWDGEGYEVYPTRGGTPAYGRWTEIATICPDVGTGESAKKNAMLICAAPNLLAALQALVDMDVAYQRGPAVSDAVQAAKAAIALATGVKS